MNLRLAASEAARNVTTGASRTLTVVVFIALSLVACSALDLITVGSIVRAAAEFRATGGATAIMSRPGGIDPDRCESLNRVPSVRAAGALRDDGVTLVAPAYPAVAVPVFEATPGLLPSLPGSGFDDARPGLYLSREAADRLGVRAGWRLAGTQSFVQGVFDYPADGRSETLRFAAVSVGSTTGEFDSCWVSVESTVAAARDIARLAQDLGAPPGEAPTLTQLNPSLGIEFDALGHYESRITRFAPAALSLVAVGVGMVWCRSRRLELASNQSVGLAPSTQAAQLVIESAMLWATGVLIASAPLAWTIGQSSDLGYAWTVTAGAAGGVLVAFSAGALLVTSRIRPEQLATLIKER